MTKLLGVGAAVAVLVLLGGVAFAQMGWAKCCPSPAWAA